jgi:hypothetical protein
MKDFSFFGDFHIDPTLTDFTKNIEEFLFNSDGLDANKFLNISEEIKHIYSWKKSAQRLKEMLD